MFAIAMIYALVQPTGGIPKVLLKAPTGRTVQHVPTGSGAFIPRPPTGQVFQQPTGSGGPQVMSSTSGSPYLVAPLQNSQTGRVQTGSAGVPQVMPSTTGSPYLVAPLQNSQTGRVQTGRVPTGPMVQQQSTGSVQYVQGQQNDPVQYVQGQPTGPVEYVQGQPRQPTGQSGQATGIQQVTQYPSNPIGVQRVPTNRNGFPRTSTSQDRQLMTIPERDTGRSGNNGLAVGVSSVGRPRVATIVTSRTEQSSHINRHGDRVRCTESTTIIGTVYCD